MILLKAYQYLFYKLYRFYETSTYSRWWSEWKALVTIIVMEMWTLFSLVFYYQAFTGDAPEIDTLVWIVGAVLAVWNWYLFEHQDEWKDIVKEFDKLPKKQNRIGSFIVLLIVSVSIANVVFSVYTLSQSVNVENINK